MTNCRTRERDMQTKQSKLGLTVNPIPTFSTGTSTLAFMCQNSIQKRDGVFYIAIYFFIFLSVQKSPPILSKSARQYPEFETKPEIKHNVGEEILFHYDCSCSDIPSERSSQHSLMERKSQSRRQVLCQTNIEAVYFGHIFLSFFFLLGEHWFF